MKRCLRIRQAKTPQWAIKRCKRIRQVAATQQWAITRSASLRQAAVILRLGLMLATVTPAAKPTISVSEQEYSALPARAMSFGLESAKHYVIFQGFITQVVA